MLDRDGLTEEEFLKAYDVSKYERPSVTVDIIAVKEGRVLLIKRGGHPCIGKLALPGGFCEQNEDVYVAAKRELFEETGLKAFNLRQLRCFSEPKRDPRTRIITVPFIADFEGDGSNFAAGDDARDAAWYAFSKRETGRGVSVIAEITLSSASGKISYKVAKKTNPSGIYGDTQYSVIGDNPLAGDHGAILCCALDAISDAEQKNNG